MNNEEYENGLKNYEELVANYFNKKINNIVKVEKKINNIDYIIKRLKENVFDSDLYKLALLSFDEICNDTKDDNNVFVLYNIKNDILIYKNLETREEIIINKDENYDFIKNNKVIIPRNINNLNTYFYDNTRNEFLYLLTKNSQNESLKRILTKN